jgi:hypothetical protein
MRSLRRRWWGERQSVESIIELFEQKTIAMQCLFFSKSKSDEICVQVSAMYFSMSSRRKVAAQFATPITLALLLAAIVHLNFSPCLSIYLYMPLSHFLSAFLCYALSQSSLTLPDFLRADKYAAVAAALAARRTPAGRSDIPTGARASDHWTTAATAAAAAESGGNEDDQDEDGGDSVEKSAATGGVSAASAAGDEPDCLWTMTGPPNKRHYWRYDVPSLYANEASPSQSAAHEVRGRDESKITRKQYVIQINFKYAMSSKQSPRTSLQVESQRYFCRVSRKILNALSQSYIILRLFY